MIRSQRLNAITFRIKVQEVQIHKWPLLEYSESTFSLGRKGKLMYLSCSRDFYVRPFHSSVLGKWTFQDLKWVFGLIASAKMVNIFMAFQQFKCGYQSRCDNPNMSEKKVLQLQHLVYCYYLDFMKHYIEELVKEFIYHWAKTFIPVQNVEFRELITKKLLGYCTEGMASFVFVNIPRKLLRFLEN